MHRLEYIHSLVMEESPVIYDVADKIHGNSTHYDTTSFSSSPQPQVSSDSRHYSKANFSESSFQVAPGCNPCYDTTDVSSPKPQVAPGCNPCYDMIEASSPKPQVAPGCSPCYDVVYSTAHVAAASVGVEVVAKKPARGCPCSWVCIGLVLVGVVACVSMAVAVWSIAEVHSVSTCAKSCSDQSTDQTDSLRSEIITLRQNIA